ncbi:glycoside hydrolase family 38 C-terminal domain-containing protein [Granulicella sp. S190]|uniref:glycoside hydrolase family 38 C-terminal domain-containing protein n=1 Tax=Granulicella sp. S190 TaxID=1747226 RepID=UPI00131C534C|nr:glycoside hydrolase family 38 C-terminal domain-containing protein [Granulicella sp. S190]
MRRFTGWKLSLDIEPSSWEALKREDPQAFEELGTYLADRSVNRRIEMVAGTFAQPYGWAIGGESNIRQLQRGLQVIHQQYPSASVTTYAVQEPCWASCLPQILRSLKFDGAVLRDASTAWGGYSAGFDADLVNWVGSDGSTITAVPRYAVERLQKVFETESIVGTAEFAAKCVENGIPHPAGMCFQDLGWPAKPRVNEPFVRFATWQEYIHKIADKPAKDWHFGIEDILVTLPWGNPTLQAVAQQVRSAENRLILAEKVASIGFMHGASQWPEQELREAWDDLLLSQAHDAWITATTRQGRQAWAFQVASDTLNAEQSAEQIIQGAASALGHGKADPIQSPLGAQWVRTINTLPFERDDLVRVSLATDPGTTGIEVTDASGSIIPSQLSITRRYFSQDVLGELSRSRSIYPEKGDKSSSTDGINDAVVSFRAKMPSIGYASYRLTPRYRQAAKDLQGKVSVTTEIDGTTVMESDLYRLRIDPKKGGAITNLWAKQLDYEFCDAKSDRTFNEYRGYFISQQGWRSSTDSPAQVKIIESGPVRATVEVSGQVGGIPYRTTISIAEGQQRIDFQVGFIFEQDTWIGDPWDIKPENRSSEQRRSQNDGRWKLQALFPVSFRSNALYKNAAFDVCRSRNADTFFQRWDEIKHNIIVNWVDVVDAEERYGIALMTDHTTAYSQGPEHPLGLVLGWAWEGGFWWGKHPLRGEQKISYAIVPHRGGWERAGISRENSRFCEPPVTALMDGKTDETENSFSLMQIDSPGVEVSAMLVEKEQLVVRLFNAESVEADHVVTFGTRPKHVDVIELDGTSKRNLEIRTVEGGRPGVHLRIPQFGLQTLSCTW